MEEFERTHRNTVRALGADCTVLLRSDGTFPLDAPCDVALYGSGARRTVPGGTGSGEVNTRFNVTVERGLEGAGFHVTTKSWLADYDKAYAAARKKFISDLKAEAKKVGINPISYAMGAVMPEPEYSIPLTGAGDTAIYVLSRISGEGSDRRPVPGDILLTRTEARDINLLQNKYRRFLLVLNVGGPVDLSPVPNVKNILLLSQLGSVTGEVLADIVLGKAAPSGKLAGTWAAWEDYCKEGDFGGVDDTRYREGIYVGYRYFESVGKKPLFPFGFGLSYTSFKLSDTTVDVEGEKVTVSATVENTGSRPGKEVLQVYVSVPEGRLDQPVKALAAWEKTRLLAPGESRLLSASFSVSELASYDERLSAWVLEPGMYVVRAGTSSADTSPAVVLGLDREVTVLKAKKCCSGADFEDWKPESPKKPEIPANLPVIRLDADSIPQKSVEYLPHLTSDPSAEELSDEALAYMGIGSFDPDGGLKSVIGCQGSTVAGAAGETTSKLRGIPSLVMADGPAGLRLTPKFYRDGKTAYGVGAGMPASFLDYIPPVGRLAIRLMSKRPPKGAVIREQYAVSIPIGSALAQSWDKELLEACGDLVGDEMERFGVHLWLAPALNLHRDIRCGRNFEYFSEDPLLTGRAAAAITRGVQKHAGRAVTVKHFAANNQETNRYFSNSLISERALREMYLRGFGICVREARPKTIMTSYNLLNGVHTSESRELIEDILRCEFGFEGVVMTDWVMEGQESMGTKHPCALSPNVAAAGGDLFMPGCQSDYDALLKAIASGAVSREQVRANASRVIWLIRELTGMV